ncbi:5-formyltetrahydrofolate cyclo-ligase [Herbaspirillum rubrisubalbicans]|uniref:5-formyltetrahydrofolate cyclo-ligase n=2 Tax=Herbaspirillum rubrisubalbicans TaxID=80842 RepID=A0ABX9BZS8_9BURK|nr:5-formyltetrahydrofolate cyclo-ligase [Herbaspirillum rubrisubalbicans]RAM63487.1 5-formyltetrahydrofolate cyclo-ligase [Herbaspirillum rubrisubalbicans]RAN48724.1 5-formyltetrahydrofolate cyclo-ligase [Herbaspirillum rubrisubalbicans]
MQASSCRLMEQKMNPSIARDTLAPDTETTRAAHHKTLLRKTLLARRKAMPAEDQARAAALIGQRVLHWCAHQAIASLAVYQAIRGEPDLSAAYNALAAQGVHLCLPVVVGKEAPLEFRAWQPGDVLEKDALGTLVPPAGAPVVQPQALLIPCLGFNAAGFRLGYGGGFYDRTLAVNPRPLAVGVCHGFGLVEFEAQMHDIALDCILTDAI